MTRPWSMEQRRAFSASIAARPQKSDAQWQAEREAARQRRNARRRGNAIPYSLRRRLYDAAGEKCPCCGEAYHGRHNPMEIDHIVPLARGGTSAPENLRVICRHCNRSKGAR